MAILNTPTGITPQAFQEMISGAGGAYLNLDLQGGESAEEVSDKLQAAIEAGDCIGTTRGGFSFDFGFDTRDIEADGKLFPFKGSTQMTHMNASVTTTLLEWTPGALETVFGNSEYDEATKKMRFRMSFTDKSYIPEIWFMFKKSGDAQGYSGIKIINALNTAGSSPASSNDGEMELPITLVGHQGSLTDSQYGPVEIYWFPAADDDTGDNGDIQGSQPQPKEMEA